MSFESTDLGFFFSTGGGSGEDRESNLGGAISDTEIEHSKSQNWFPDISRSIVGAVGSTGTWAVYAPFYVKNKNETVTITDVKLVIDHEPSNPSISIQMGFDPAGVNDTIQTIDDIEDAPTGVTFHDPETTSGSFWWSWTEQTVFNVASSFAPGDYCGLWVKIYGPKGLTSIPVIKFQLKCSFVRPA